VYFTRTHHTRKITDKKLIYIDDIPNLQHSPYNSIPCHSAHAIPSTSFHSPHSNPEPPGSSSHSNPRLPGSNTVISCNNYTEKRPRHKSRDINTEYSHFHIPYAREVLFLDGTLPRTGVYAQGSLRFPGAAFSALGLLLTLRFLFNPSNTKTLYPDNYGIVEKGVRKGGGVSPANLWPWGAKKGRESERENPARGKVSIAGNIIDDDLITGVWGNAVMELGN